MTASSLLPSSRHAPGTRIRPVNYASAAERHAVALLLVRAFANNKMQRWLGGLERPGISSLPSTSTSETDVQILPRDVRNLYLFFAAWLATTVISGGRAMVVVEPTTSSTPLNSLHVRSPDEASSNDHERLLAVALWHAPGSSASSLSTLVRSKQHRTLTGGVSLLQPWNWTGWGVSGLYRAIVRTQGSFVKAHTEACSTRGLDKVKCWALESLAADPEAEGKGYGGLLLQEGMNFLDAQAPQPACLLEASEERPKAIYERAGWEVTAKLCIGEGLVDKDGFRCASSTATGLTTWSMLRMPGGKQPNEKTPTETRA